MIVFFVVRLGLYSFFGGLKLLFFFCLRSRCLVCGLIVISWTTAGDGTTETQTFDIIQETIATQDIRRKLGTKKEFHVKMEEIANKDDGKLIVALMDIDDLGSYLFSNNNKHELAEKEVLKIEKEIIELFGILGNDNNNDGGNDKDKHFFGYKLTSGDEFGLIIYDSKDFNKCLIPGHDVLETLLLRIRDNCHVTVFIRYCKFIDDDLRMCDD